MRRSCGRCSHDEDEFGVHLHRMWSDSVHGTPCGTLMPPTGYRTAGHPHTVSITARITGPICDKVRHSELKNEIKEQPACEY